MFEAKENKAERTGQIIGFGFAMVLFVSVFYYISSHFISFFDFKKYLIIIFSLILIYTMWAIINQSKNE